MKELKTKYDPKEVESGKYDFWLKGGFFKSGDKTKEPFTIVIPPPNVTGQLHLGHAWDTTLQDIIIRQKRMLGYDALWLPGCDHAGIATQAKIDQKLKDQGTSRYELGREKFLDAAWDWVKEYKAIIHSQWAALGLSVDYDKERFTLDEGLNNAVNFVFVEMYKRGLIYRGNRIINWDSEAKTALSNIEVEHKEIEGAFYYFKYPFVDSKDSLIIATTRPETMFADQAIMVHPKDKRYKKLVGKKVYIPGTKVQIPIIADEYVDMEFGSGCVKVTPAHDPNDYEVGIRHNLEMPLCMDDGALMNEMAFEYKGLDRFTCRKQLVANLDKLGLVEKIEKINHTVGHSERTGVVVEPRLSKQWFVKMDDLSKNALEKSTVDFIPERFNNTFKRWMENAHDWCISRQLWWGHRIPAWYKGEEVKVQVECPGKDWVQDEDVLDTWFSSGLWPFSTLGWPEKTEDFDRYFPTDVLVTGYDIIFFWVARMIFNSIEFTKQSPFKKCFIHGLIRDKEGKKMSKSLGNGVDPLDMKEKYGIDSLRYFLTTNSAPGLDLRFDEEKVLSSWNYINKLWNVSRYVLMNIDEKVTDEIDYKNLSIPSKWILEKLNKLITEVNTNYDKYEFGEVARSIYNFVYDDFASSYVELTKVDLTEETVFSKSTKSVLVYVLKAILKLLHPFIPFVTEEIYLALPHKHESISISSWPVVDKNVKFDNDYKFMSIGLDIITNVRNIRSSMNHAMSKPITLNIQTKTITPNNLNDINSYIIKFVNATSLNIQDKPFKEESISKVLDDVTIFIPSSELINKEEEIKRLEEELKKLNNELTRSRNMLNNENFVSRAKPEKIAEEKAKLTKYEEQYKEVEKLLNSYK